MLWLALALHGSQILEFLLAHAFLHAAGCPFNSDFFVSPRLAESAAPAAFCCAFDFAGMEFSSVLTQQGGTSERTASVFEGSHRSAAEQSHALVN